MELRRFLHEKRLKQITVIRAGADAGYVIDSSDFSRVVNGVRAPFKPMRFAIIAALRQLKYSAAEIKAIEELSPAPVD